MDVDMTVAVGDYLVCGGNNYELVDHLGGEYYLQAITDMPRNNVNRDFQRRQEEERARNRQLAADTQAARVRRITHSDEPASFSGGRSSSIMDQVRPFVESTNMAWSRIENAMIYGQSLTHVDSAGNARNVSPASDEARRTLSIPTAYFQPAYTAGMDGVQSGLASSISNVQVYERSGFNALDLDRFIGEVTASAAQSTEGGDARSELRHNNTALAQALEQVQRCIADGRNPGPGWEDDLEAQWRRWCQGSRSAWVVGGGGNEVLGLFGPRYEDLATISGENARGYARAASIDVPVHDRSYSISRNPDGSTTYIAQEGTSEIRRTFSRFPSHYGGWGLSGKGKPATVAAEPSVAELAKQQAEADEWLKSSPWG
jgi:hypothetical protein